MLYNYIIKYIQSKIYNIYISLTSSLPKIKTNKGFLENFNSHMLMTFKYLYTFTALLVPFFILTVKFSMNAL